MLRLRIQLNTFQSVFIMRGAVSRNKYSGCPFFICGLTSTVIINGKAPTSTLGEKHGLGRF